MSSIQETFKGSDKVATILQSLNDLFTVFDSENGRRIEGELDSSKKNVERGMLLGVITVLLDHLIKGIYTNIKFSFQKIKQRSRRVILYFMFFLFTIPIHGILILRFRQKYKFCAF